MPRKSGAERACLPALCLSLALCLVALRIRRELLDLCLHYFGPHGVAANHDSARSGFANGKVSLRGLPVPRGSAFAEARVSS
jgi:hypothetical protein